MRKLRVMALVTVGASTIPVGILATGVAAADDYAGKTYADAVSAITSAGQKAVILTRSGGMEPDDKCVVTSSEQAPWIKGDAFARVTDTVLLNLNCSAGVASAKTPGSSAASPEGRAATQAAKNQAKGKH